MRRTINYWHHRSFGSVFVISFRRRENPFPTWPTVKTTTGRSRLRQGYYTCLSLGRQERNCCPKDPEKGKSIDIIVFINRIDLIAGGPAQLPDRRVSHFSAIFPSTYWTVRCRIRFGETANAYEQCHRGDPAQDDDTFAYSNITLIII